jgi:hypothetical protein
MEPPRAVKVSGSAWLCALTDDVLWFISIVG